MFQSSRAYYPFPISSFKAWHSSQAVVSRAGGAVRATGTMPTIGFKHSKGCQRGCWILQPGVPGLWVNTWGVRALFVYFCMPFSWFSCVFFVLIPPFDKHKGRIQPVVLGNGISFPLVVQQPVQLPNLRGSTIALQVIP